MSEHMSPIPGRIYNAAVGGHVCGPEDLDFGQKVIHLIKYDRAGNEVSFESQVTQANKIYVIHDDFILSSNVTIPANCILEFDGGSISGAHTITGNNTGINAGLVKIFNTDVTLAGTWNVVEVYPKWFGAKGDGTTDDTIALQKTFDLKKPVLLGEKKNYKTSEILYLYNSLNGNNSTITATKGIPDPVYYTSVMAINIKMCSDFVIQNLEVVSACMGLTIGNCHDFELRNIKINTIKFGITFGGYEIDGVQKWCERFIVDNIEFKQNPATINTDGLHFNAWCRYGKITNITGSVGDDFIALNAPEGWAGDRQVYDPIGAIEFLDFVNCKNSEDSFAGVRFYGVTNNNIRNIKFTNCNFCSGASRWDMAVKFVPFGTMSSADSPTDNTLHVSNIVFENCKMQNKNTEMTHLCSVTMMYVDGDITFNNCEFEKHSNINESILIQKCNIDLTFNNCIINGIRAYYTRVTESRYGKIRAIFNNTKLKYTGSVTTFFNANTAKASNVDYILIFNDCTVLNETSYENVETVIFDELDASYGRTAEIRANNTKRFRVHSPSAGITENIHIDHCDYCRCYMNRDVPGYIEINHSARNGNANNVVFNNDSLVETVFNGESVYTSGRTKEANLKKGTRWCNSDDNLYVVVDDTKHYERVVQTTAQRTARNWKYVGDCCYDFDLKKEVYWNGTAWVDATGTPV